MLASVLLSIHNLYYLLDLMRRARTAIIEHRYQEFIDDWMATPASHDF